MQIFPFVKDQVNESKTLIGLEVEWLPESNLFTIDPINTLTE